MTQCQGNYIIYCWGPKSINNSQILYYEKYSWWKDSWWWQPLKIYPKPNIVSAVITLSNVSWYYMLQCNDRNNTQTTSLTHWGRDKMADISQTTFSNVFSSMWMFEFRLKLKFVPKGPINTIPALAQIMAWRRPGDKPLSEAMLISLPMHICISFNELTHKIQPIARPSGWVRCVRIWEKIQRIIAASHCIFTYID